MQLKNSCVGESYTHRLRMHTIEPFYRWEKYYQPQEDEHSPFYGKEYVITQYTNEIYGYYSIEGRYTSKLSIFFSGELRTKLGVPQYSIIQIAYYSESEDDSWSVFGDSSIMDISDYRNGHISGTLRDIILPDKTITEIKFNNLSIDHIKL